MSRGSMLHAVRRTPSRAWRLLTGLAEEYDPRAMPPMLRANYARELGSWFLLPVMLATVEGGTIGVIAKKSFTGVEGITQGQLDLAVALLMAAANVANLTSFLWAAAAHGRPKVSFINRLQVGCACCVGLIALIPDSALGLFLLCLLVAMARTAWTGVLTLRSVVWRHNYPRASRTVVAGRMATVQSLVLAVTALGIGWLLDLDPRSYHLLFPLLALAGIGGSMVYGKVRLRGQVRLQSAERALGEDAPSHNPMRLVRILREDRDYRRFMGCMTVLGWGNLMLGAPQALVLTDVFHASYLTGILNTTVIPVAVMPLAIPFWSRRLSSMHVVRFRAIHSWTFVAASLLMTVAVWLRSMPLMQASAVVLGFGFAGGALAWNLGHQDFAAAHRDSEYMGVHVTLNGIRGLLAPLSAAWVYAAFGGASAPAWVFGVATGVTALGALGFVMHWRHLRKLPQGRLRRTAPTGAAEAFQQGQAASPEA